MTAVNAIATASAAIAAVASCVALRFAWLATSEGRKAVKEARAARIEAESERRRLRLERIAAINEEVFADAFGSHQGEIIAIARELRLEQNKMRALVVGLQSDLPHACAVPKVGTNGDVVKEAGEARHEIALAIADLDSRVSPACHAESAEC